MRNYYHHHWKIGYNFEMKGRIKIRRRHFVSKLTDNTLAKFQPNCSRGCRLGVQNVCTTHSNFHIEKEGKMRLATPRRQLNKVLIDK